MLWYNLQESSSNATHTKQYKNQMEQNRTKEYAK